MSEWWAGHELEFWALLRVCIAVIVGAVIGIERELAEKPAGLRTHMLVAGSSALFVGLAWFAWHGALALVIAALLAAELLVTAVDEFVENRIRVLPQNERVLHVFLTLNLGLLIALLAPVLLDWYRQPLELAGRSHGALSWLLTALGVAAGAWSLRDFVAWRRLRRASVAA